MSWDDPPSTFNDRCSLWWRTVPFGMQLFKAIQTSSAICHAMEIPSWERSHIPLWKALLSWCFSFSRLVGYAIIPCKVNAAVKRRVDVDSKMEIHASSNRMWMTICWLWLLWCLVGCWLMLIRTSCNFQSTCVSESCCSCLKVTETPGQRLSPHSGPQKIAMT